MKKILSAITLASTMAVASQASAVELWDPQLAGVDEGYAAAAVGTLPAGVYGILDNYWAEFRVYNNKANSVAGTNLSALVEVPIVAWVPGIKVLGGDFWTAIAQPFDFTSFGPTNNNGGTGSGNWGTYNTVLFPANIDWKFGDFYVGTGLRIGIADATTTYADIINGNWHAKSGLPSGNGYWTVQPDFTASWLHDGWNISIWTHFPIPVSSTNATGYSYHSGVEYQGDYTIAKTLGKWTVGLGAYQINQFNTDSCTGFNCPNYYGPGSSSDAHKIAGRFGLGPIVSYQFTGISVEAIVNQSVYTRNDVGGLFANIRFVVPF